MNQGSMRVSSWMRSMGDAEAQGGADVPQALRVGAAEQGLDAGGGGVRGLDVEAVGAGLEAAHRLAERLAHGAADGHDLADRLHLDGEGLVGALELLEGEAGDLGDDVVDARLEAGRGDAGDVVVELVERVADGELGGELGDREAGGLGGEGRRARDAGVHLDDDHPPAARVDGELDVAAAGGDADLGDHRARGVAHALVLLVGEGLGGGDGDAVAGVHAHGVEVLDRADDDEVVLAVAHDLELVLFPAEHRLLDQDLVAQALAEGVLDLGLELVAVVRDGGAAAPEGEAGADDRGEADLLERGAGLGDRVAVDAARDVEADLQHRGLELVAVLGLLDRQEAGADQLDAVAWRGCPAGRPRARGSARSGRRRSAAARRASRPRARGRGTRASAARRRSARPDRGRS
jgi:hypothetical protein